MVERVVWFIVFDASCWWCSVGQFCCRTAEGCVEIDNVTHTPDAHTPSHETHAHHFFFWIVCIMRCAKNGQTIMNMNQVGEISAKGHHVGYLTSKILDLFIDDLVVKFNTLISILMFTFFLSCWFFTSPNDRSSKLMRVCICCTSLRIVLTVLSSWLIVDVTSTISNWWWLPPFVSGVSVCELPLITSYRSRKRRLVDWNFIRKLMDSLKVTYG